MDPEEPLPFEMAAAKPRTRDRRRSSILKPTRPVLQDINTNAAAAAPAPPQVQRKVEKSRRVSFSRNQQIKKFAAGQDNLTVWDSSYHEEMQGNSSAGNSSTQLPAKGPRADLQGGELAAVSPSKALPLNIAIPAANSPNKFLPNSRADNPDLLHSKPGPLVDSGSFLSSLAAARRDSESTDTEPEGDSSFARLIGGLGSRTVVGEVDMSRTVAAISDSMLSDEEQEEVEVGKVNAMGFLSNMGSNKTVVGGGMDMTMAPDKTTMDTTLASDIVASNKTVVGGGMDMTMASGIMSSNRTQVGGGMDMTLASHVARGSRTVLGGVMDATLGLAEEGLEGSMVEDSVFAPRHPSVAELPDSLPGSSNTSLLPGSSNNSFDGGATATMKFSGLMMANNTLQLPHRSSQEEEEEEEFTRAPEQFFSYDPAALISRQRVVVAGQGPRPSCLRRAGEESGEGEGEGDKEMEKGAEATKGQGEMEMTRVEERSPSFIRAQSRVQVEEVRGDRTRMGGLEMEMTRMEVARPEGDMTRAQSRDMEMTRVGGDMTRMRSNDMEMTRAQPQAMEMTRVQSKEMEVTKEQSSKEMEGTKHQPQAMEMTKVAGRQAEEMEMTKVAEEMEMTRAEESGWETQHSALLAVSPPSPPARHRASPLPALLPPRRSEAEALRLQFPSPEASPEVTRLVRAMPRRPAGGAWEGEVTSFLPGGESTRAFRLPPTDSTASLSPLPLPRARDLPNLTTFAPMEEYESTRKVPTMVVSPPSPLPLSVPKDLPNLTSFSPLEDYESTRKVPAMAARKGPTRVVSPPSPLALPEARDLPNLTTFAPTEDYESTRKVPTMAARKALSVLTEATREEVTMEVTMEVTREQEEQEEVTREVTVEVTSPNSGLARRRQETMVAGLEITRAPGCSCVAWNTGGEGCRVHREEEQEQEEGCSVHREKEQEEQKQQEVLTGQKEVQEEQEDDRSPQVKRSGGNQVQEEAKRARREEVQVEEEGSPEKRQRLSMETTPVEEVITPEVEEVQSVEDTVSEDNTENKTNETETRKVQTNELEPQNVKVVDEKSEQEEPEVNEAKTIQEVQATELERVDEGTNKVCEKEKSEQKESDVKEVKSRQAVQAKEPEGIAKGAESKGVERAVAAEEPVVSVFEDLAARQEAAACPSCSLAHGGWRLLGARAGVAAVAWLEDSLALVVTLGAPLPAKARRAAAGRRVQHHTITGFAWRPLHAGGGEQDEEAAAISEAQASLTRRFPPAALAAECLNTFSLSALLQKVSHYAAAAHAYLAALHTVRAAHHPFAINQGRVTLGFVSRAPEQSLVVEVDMSGGFAAAPASVRLVAARPALPAAHLAKLAAAATAGPAYLANLAATVQEYLANRAARGARRSLAARPPSPRP